MDLRSNGRIHENPNLKWNCSIQCQSAIEEKKYYQTLTHYNSKDIIASDTSNLILGAIILHKETNS